MSVSCCQCAEIVFYIVFVDFLVAFIMLFVVVVFIVNVVFLQGEKLSPAHRTRVDADLAQPDRDAIFAEDMLAGSSVREGNGTSGIGSGVVIFSADWAVRWRRWRETRGCNETGKELLTCASRLCHLCCDFSRHWSGVWVLPCCGSVLMQVQYCGCTCD